MDIIMMKQGLLLFFMLLTACVVVRSDYVTLQNYVECAGNLFAITKDNACSQLQTVLTCVEDLIDDGGLRSDKSKPFCDGEASYPYCSMMDGSQSAPMVGSDHPSICSSYKKIKTCDEKQCGPEGNKFQNTRDMMQGDASNNENSCPKQATKDCISPVKTVTKLNKDTCIAVAKAKSCFVDKLNYCAGSDEEQLAVDIILAGLVQHVSQCQEKEISFSQDGDICVPNPLDVYVPRGLEQQMLFPDNFANENEREKAKQTFLKANCPTIERVGTELENYLRNCNASSTSSYDVGNVINKLNGPRLLCMKSGYNLPPRDSDCSQNGSTINDGPASGAIAVFTVALFIVITRYL